MNNLEQDLLLLAGLARQDKDAIEKIYAANFKMVQHLILNNNGTADDAADIFQETMIVLYEKSISPGFSLSSQLKTYIYSVSRRLWLKKIQQQQRFAIHDEEIDLPNQEELSLEQHQKNQLRFNILENALTKIGEPCKSLIEAFYMKNKQMQQIATEFNYTNADNAKTQKYKSLVRLKKLFFAEYKNL